MGSRLKPTDSELGHFIEQRLHFVVDVGQNEKELALFFSHQLPELNQQLQVELASEVPRQWHQAVWMLGTLTSRAN